MIFGISRLETNANFSSPKQHRIGFRISDPPKNTRKGSEFLIPQWTLKRVQNFWSPKNTRKGSEFQIPQRTLQRVQNFWSPKGHYKGSRICENDLPSGYSTSPETLTVYNEPSQVCTAVEETWLGQAAGSVRSKHESLLAQNNARPGFFEWQHVRLAPAESTIIETAKD